MQISKKELKPELENRLQQIFIELLSDINSPEDAKQIIQSLFSETERVAIMKRIGIACMLEEHTPYEKIKSELNVSSATIASVQSLMSQDGMQLILEKIKISLTANQWSNKLKNLFNFRSKKKN